MKDQLQALRSHQSRKSAAMNLVRVVQARNTKNAMGDKIFQAIIESPKGDNRRRHFDKGTNRVVDIEPLKNVIPVNNGIAPVNYGLLVGTHCEADDEEVDVLIISENKLKIGQKIKVYPIALMQRKDGDDKILASDESVMEKYKEWGNLSGKERELIRKFFSYHHKFYAIKNRVEAIKYIERHGI